MKKAYKCSDLYTATFEDGALMTGALNQLYAAQNNRKMTIKPVVWLWCSDSGLYMVEQHINGKDIPYVDGSTGQEVGFRNVLVLYTDVAQINGDSAGRMKVRTTGNGEGLLLRDGMLYEITWQRDSRNDCLSFLDQSGAPVSLGVGTSYINLVDTSAEVSWG